MQIFGMNVSGFSPRLFSALHGYKQERFLADVGAGISVGVVALPLSLAFAIASGLTPSAGLWTAIIAGFLISVLGGSQVQIGGPAGAFIVIVYGIVERYGLGNLIIATAMSGVMLFFMGLFKLGTLVRFIPIAVVIGFTNGIAVLVGLSQIKDFLGLQVSGMPANFFGMLQTLAGALHSWNLPTVLVACGSLAIVVLWQVVMPRFINTPTLSNRLTGMAAIIPGAIVALIVATALVSLFDVQVDTIGSRFGGIPATLPSFAWPAFSWESARFLIIPATTLALLGAIESLLSARVADGLIDQRHDPNQELMAQGIANFVTPFFGGMPATGTIARTMTNIKSGATSPVAGMVHALSLLLMVLVAAPLASHVPLATLSAIMLFVAWNMGEWREFLHLRQFRMPYRITLLAVFFLTVVFDLTVAVEVGLMAACVTFIYRISSLSRSEMVSAADQPLLQDMAGKVDAYRLYGALFFGAVKLLEAIEDKLPSAVLVLDLKNVIYFDTSGADALAGLARKCRKSHTRLIICGLAHQPLEMAERSGLARLLDAGSLCPSLVSGLAAAVQHVQKD